MIVNYLKVSCLITMVFVTIRFYLNNLFSKYQINKNNFPEMYFIYAGNIIYIQLISYIYNNYKDILNLFLFTIH